MVHNPKKPIERSPRLLKGAEGAALEKLLWTKPNFHVMVSAKPLGVEFRFRIPLSRETAAQYPIVKSLFFGPGARDFGRELSRSYWKTVSGKNVSRFISNLLHLVFHNAVKRWLKSGWDLRANEQSNEEMKKYMRDAKSKRGQQPDPILALWATSQLKSLKKKVQTMKNAYAKKKVRGAAMWNLAEKVAPRDVLHKALTQLIANRDNIEALFLDKRFTTNRIATAILEVEFAERYNPGLNARRIPLEKHQNVGKALQTRLETIPQPLNTRSKL